MFQRLVGLILGAVMAFPASAQDAGPLELGAGMRAYTTRVFVEPQVLAELSVGDEVSFYTTYFTPWDYLNAEGVDDTIVVRPASETARILAIGQPDIKRATDPLVEVSVRLEAAIEDISVVRMADAAGPGQSFPAETEGGPPAILLFRAPLIMTKLNGGLPEFCPTCETLLFEAYAERFSVKDEHCYFTIRRGVNVERRELPCRDD